jgi:hypothetical protein
MAQLSLLCDDDDEPTVLAGVEVRARVGKERIGSTEIEDEEDTTELSIALTDTKFSSRESAFRWASIISSLHI